MFRIIQKYLVVLILLSIILASSWALFRSDFFRVHDFTQGARIVEMTAGLKDGHFPVIWSSNLGYGYGMPLFEFYAPLPYYVGSLLYIIGFSLIDSIKLLMLLTAVGTTIGGYVLGKRLFGITGGLLVSAALTLAPYRAVNLFVRGAVSEAWGIMCLPFILLGIIKTVKGEKNGWLILLGSITVLLLSHNLTALVFLPFSILFGLMYVLLESKSDKKIKKYFWNIVLKLAALYGLAVLLSSFYTVPALLEKDFTRLEPTILADYFNYKLHFLSLRQFFIENWGYGGSTYGPLDDISFYLGFGQLLGLFLSGYIVLKAVAGILQKKGTLSLEKHTIFYLFFIVILAVSLLMTTAKLEFIWELFPALEFLQFPWRYLSAATVFLALAIGSLPALLQNKLLKFGYGLFLLLLMIVMNSKYFQPEIFRSDLSDYFYSDENKLRTEMSNTLPDYIPIQIQQKVIEPAALRGHVLYCQVIENCVISYKILDDKVHIKRIAVTSHTDQQLVFAIADFPGWSADIDGVKTAVTQSDEGFVQVSVPAGEHTVSIQLKQTPVRQFGLWLTIVGVGVSSGIFFWYHKKK
ncbi:MAG: membrane protein [Patescibacteria group bacterium]|nr:MAG: membrane protein [Patescibacteria group bacterium]